MTNRKIIEDAMKHQKIIDDAMRHQKIIDDAMKHQKIIDDAMKHQKIIDDAMKLQLNDAMTIIGDAMKHQLDDAMNVIDGAMIESSGQLKKLGDASAALALSDAMRMDALFRPNEIMRDFERTLLASDQWVKTLALAEKSLAQSAFFSVAEEAARAVLRLQDVSPTSFPAELSSSLATHLRLQESALFKLADATFSTIGGSWTNDFLEEMSRSTVRAGLRELRIADIDLEGIASNVVARSLEEYEASAESTDGDTFSLFVANVWTRIVDQFPQLSQESRVSLFGLVVTVCMTVFLFGLSAISSSRDTEKIVASELAVAGKIDSLRTELSALVPDNSIPRRRMTATRSIPLRFEHDSRAKRVGTLEAGQELEVVDQFERWLYVRCLGDNEKREGWVYYRNLQPH